MIELNRIYNEDCLEGMKRIPDKSIDLIITDPPYLHVKGGMKSKKYNTGTWKANSDMNQKMSDFGEQEINNFREPIQLFYDDNGQLKPLQAGTQTVSIEPSKKEMRKIRKRLKRLGYGELSAAEQCFIIIKYVVMEKAKQILSKLRRRSK